MLSARNPILPIDAKAYALFEDYHDLYEEEFLQRVGEIARARRVPRINLVDVETAYRELSGNNE